MRKMVNIRLFFSSPSFSIDSLPFFITIVAFLEMKRTNIMCVYIDIRSCQELYVFFHIIDNDFIGH